MNNNLIDKSDELFEKAKGLLKQFPLEKLATNNFNNIKIIGSSANNTMLNADIDINCELKQLDTITILRFVNDLLNIKECRKISLYNQLSNDRSHFIVNVERFEYENEKWIITFFISTNLGEAPEHLDWVNENMDKEKRQVILELKDYRERNNQKRSIPSYLIYKAVLSGDVRTIPNFKKFLEEKGINHEEKDAY